MCGNDYENIQEENNTVSHEMIRIQQNCQAKLEEFGRESQGRPLIMMVAGRSGVGKSSFTTKFLELNDGECTAGDGADPTTKYVTLHERKKRNVPVQIIDSPGLGNIDDDTTSKKQLKKDLSQVTNKKADILFYCVSMHDSYRVDATDVAIIKVLTAAFGEEIWRHTILLLTFANERKDSPERYDHLVKSYATQFEKALNYANIFKIPVRSLFSDECRSKGIIPAVPVGYDPHRPLPLCDNWSDRLLIEVIERSDAHTARQLLQLKGIDLQQAAEIAGCVAAGTAAGAAVGTAIGAPFLGAGSIPGAAVGASVGAVLGGAAGVATPSFITKLKNKFLLWKAERNLQCVARVHVM